MIGIIFIGMLLALIWGAVLGFGLPVPIALLPTLVAVAASVAVIVLRKMKAAKSAKEIESVLAAQGAAQAENVRPDRKPEVEAMQAEFAKAVGSLKTSKLGKGGSSALAVLPWYLLIGPPGGGKSTALRNSGLKFRFLSAKGGGVRGVGGTRNCEWWLTNEAIILDTAGRYATEDDDHDEWFSFLDTLRKTRPKRPVNGLVVAISVGELCGTEQEAASRGKLLRARVDEVMARLRMSLPIYVVFTKLDLISGFADTFGHLPKSERKQIWGFTESVADRDEPVNDRFGQRFDELLEVLQALCLSRLSQERRNEVRERIFQFPQQLAGLKENLTEFVGELFAEDAYQETPLMRGMYFTSGTQEGRPIDRVMDAMASAFGLPRALPQSSAPATDPKSYFLGELFSEVIFRDQNLARTSAKESKRLSLLRYGYAAGALLFAILLCLLPTVSFFENQSLMGQVREQVKAVSGVVAAGGGLAKTLRTLEPLQQQLTKLNGWTEDGAPWKVGFGMYQGDTVFQSASPFYAAVLQQLLVKPTLQNEARGLRMFAMTEGQAGASDADRVTDMNRLQLYMLLTGPRGDGEPSPNDTLKQWTGKALAERWSKRPELSGGDSAKRATADAHLYAALLERNPALLLHRDRKLVKQARASLSGLSLTHLALEQIVAGAGLESEQVTLRAIVGASAVYLKDSSHVRGGFTRNGYDEKISDALGASKGVPNAWVLGRHDDGDPKAFQQALRSEYFHQYIEAWRRFVDGLRIQVPSRRTEVLGMLQDLTGSSPSPLQRVFQVVAYNTRLGESEGKLAKAAGSLEAMFKKKLGGRVGKLARSAGGMIGGKGPISTESSVEQAFRGLVRFGVAPKAAAGAAPQPTGLDAYQEQLTFLRDALFADVQNPEDHGPLIARLKTARVQVASLLAAQPMAWRPRLESLLTPPLSGITLSSTNAVAADAETKWCEMVVRPFWEHLGNDYPFRKDAPDAAVADVAEFFRPQSGTLDAFYQSALKNDIQRTGDAYSFSQRLGGVVSKAYRPDLLFYLARARKISEVLFPRHATEPEADFSIQVRPSPGVESTTLLVDGQEIDYRNGPEQWHDLKWPGPVHGGGAALRVRGTQGVSDSIERDGEWGIFRLLDAAKIRTLPGGRALLATWTLPKLGKKVTLELRPKREDNPFLGSRGHVLGLFQSEASRPPKNIARSGGRCDF